MNESASGIPSCLWLERLAHLVIAENRHHMAGPTFCGRDGFVINSSWLNKELHHILSKLQETRVDHVPRGLVVTEVFNVYRLFCTGATTRAREANVPNDVTETNNRWSKIERKSSGMPRMSMAELYTEIRQADATKICFSKSL